VSVLTIARLLLPVAPDGKVSLKTISSGTL
jgi:hypothetical protein